MGTDLLTVHLCSDPPRHMLMPGLNRALLYGNNTWCIPPASGCSILLCKGLSSLLVLRLYLKSSLLWSEGHKAFQIPLSVIHSTHCLCSSAATLRSLPEFEPETCNQLVPGCIRFLRETWTQEKKKSERLGFCRLSYNRTFWFSPELNSLKSLSYVHSNNNFLPLTCFSSPCVTDGDVDVEKMSLVRTVWKACIRRVIVLDL